MKGERFEPMLRIEVDHSCKIKTGRPDSEEPYWRGKYWNISRIGFQRMISDPTRGWSHATRSLLNCRACHQPARKALGFKIKSKWCLAHTYEIHGEPQLDRMPITKQDFLAWPNNETELINRMRRSV